MTCPACHHDRTDCHACAGICPTCAGAGELADNPGWPDPQCEVRFECPTCKGEGMLNPDLNNTPETYTERWLRHTREDTAAALFDEAFDELLARQDRMAEYAPAAESSRAIPLAPRNDPSSGGRPVSPSGPAASEDDERKAA